MQTALQNQGHTNWGITLESSEAAEPVSADYVPPCQNYFGSFCLGGQFSVHPIFPLVKDVSKIVGANWIGVRAWLAR